MSDEKVTPRKNEFSREWEYELLEDMEVDVGGEPVVIPRYFSYDGASIPRLAWQAIYTPFDPVVMLPALIHDWLYSNHQVNRNVADRTLKRLLRANGVSSFKAGSIYRAVDIFGADAWKNDADDIRYLKWLRQKLVADGIDVTQYRFPPEASP